MLLCSRVPPFMWLPNCSLVAPYNLFFLVYGPQASLPTFTPYSRIDLIGFSWQLANIVSDWKNTTSPTRIDSMSRSTWILIHINIPTRIVNTTLKTWPMLGSFIHLFFKVVRGVCSWLSPAHTQGEIHLGQVASPVQAMTSSSVYHSVSQCSESIDYSSELQQLTDD